MRIHRDGSLAHAEGWEQSQIPDLIIQSGCRHKRSKVEREAFVLGYVTIRYALSISENPLLLAEILQRSLGNKSNGVTPRFGIIQRANRLLKSSLVKNPPNRIESVNFTSLSLQFVT
jgi:hypothetical protein